MLWRAARLIALTGEPEALTDHEMSPAAYPNDSVRLTSGTSEDSP